MFCGNCSKILVLKLPCRNCDKHFCSSICVTNHLCTYQKTSRKKTLNSQHNKLYNYLSSNTVNNVRPSPQLTEIASPQMNLKVKQFPQEEPQISLIVEGTINKVQPKLLSSSEFNEFDLDLGNSKVIGVGSYGEVFLSKNKKTNELFAIKHLIKERVIQKGIELKNIYQEIQFHSQLNHPNIIKLYSYYETKDEIFMVLEYAEKGSLFQYIKNKKSIPENEALHYFIETANGINFLHDNNFMHRDIKPENLLLNEKNELKICDFGLCYIDSIGNRSTFCGTFDYMAPEIINGNSYGKSVDIWSLGILLYEMLYGTTPFKNNKILTFNEFKTVSKETKDLIRSLLINNPKKRIGIKNIFSHKAILNYASQKNLENFCTEKKDHKNELLKELRKEVGVNTNDGNKNSKNEESLKEDSKMETPTNNENSKKTYKKLNTMNTGKLLKNKENNNDNDVLAKIKEIQNSLHKKKSLIRENKDNQSRESFKEKAKSMLNECYPQRNSIKIADPIENNIKERLTLLVKRFTLELNKKIVGDNNQLEEAIDLISLTNAETRVKTYRDDNNIQNMQNKNNFINCCAEPDRVTLIKK